MTLRSNWYSIDNSDAKDLTLAGVYQWSIGQSAVYVGKAKTLGERLRDYPLNVRGLLEGRPYHVRGRTYRDIHRALMRAYEDETAVIWTVLETCDPSIRAARERWWIHRRRREEAQGGPHVLNVT